MVNPREHGASPSAKALQEEREELHARTDHRQGAKPIPELISLNPAVAPQKLAPLPLAAAACAESACHPEGELRRSWMLLDRSAEPKGSVAELPDLG